MEPWLEMIPHAWELFSHLALPWHLCLIFILAAILQYFVPRMVVKQLAIQRRVVGFAPSPDTQVAAQKHLVRLLSAAVALALVPGVAVGIGWIVTNKFLIYAVRGEDFYARTLTVHASSFMVDKVTITVPRSCNYKSERGATIIFVDPGSGSHSIEVDRFVAPQSVTILCENGDHLEKRNVVIEAQPEGPYFLTELQTYQFRTYIAGGLTWLIGVFVTFIRVRLLSR